MKHKENLLNRNVSFLLNLTLIVVILIVFFAVACGGRKKDVDQYKWGINPELLPEVVMEKDFPELVQGSADEIWGFAGKDLSEKDLTNLSLPFIAKLTFDQNTCLTSLLLTSKSFFVKQLSMPKATNLLYGPTDLLRK